MKRSFEIPVYNAEVRNAVKNGTMHPNFEEKWADTHLITVSAHTPDEAWDMCLRKHPERLGFVLGEISEVL